MKAITPVILATIVATSLITGCSRSKQNKAQASVSNEDISDAYVYLLGRLLVLRQERLDFEKDGFQWNKIVYRQPGGVQWANPNLDVAYSEAWVAVDDNTCVELEIPKIVGRYYTWHMLNGWGETTLNINERTFPQRPFGKYALCLKGSNPQIPTDALRVDLPSRTSRVLARVELGADSKQAVRLQHEFKLTALGQPQIATPPQVPLFTNEQLPGADAFDNATAILASEPDINSGMEPLQAKVKAVEAFVKSGADSRQRVDQVIKEQAQPRIFGRVRNLGLNGNGWTRPPMVGNYGSNYEIRTVVNLVGIWANSGTEATYFGNVGLDGSTTYTQTFQKGELPKDKAKYFWSVIAVDGKEYKVIPNPLSRYLLNNQSHVKTNPDGSLTLVFAPKQPSDHPQNNWLPTPAGEKYNLTFRFYGPTKDISGGQYFPPPLVQSK